MFIPAPSACQTAQANPIANLSGARTSPRPPPCRVVVWPRWSSPAASEHTHAHPHPPPHTRAHTRAHKRTQTHTNAHNHTRTRTHAHAHHTHHLPPTTHHSHGHQRARGQQARSQEPRRGGTGAGAGGLGPRAKPQGHRQAHWQRRAQGTGEGGAPGAWCLVSGGWFVVHGVAWRMGHGAWGGHGRTSGRRWPHVQ